MKKASGSKGILIVKNITREDPGLIENVIIRHDIRYEITDLTLEQKSLSPLGYDAIIILGGPDSANDDSAKIRYALELASEAIASGIPYLGICLGLQLMVKAAGGKVVRNHEKEIGFLDPEGNPYIIDLTPEGRKDPLFEGLEDNFRVFQLHGETVVPTDEMLLLATGKHCLNQVVRKGKSAYGIQCHFELTVELLDILLGEDEDLVNLSSSQLKDEFRASGDTYRKTGERLFTNFLRIAGLIQ